MNAPTRHLQVARHLARPPQTLTFLLALAAGACGTSLSPDDSTCDGGACAGDITDDSSAPETGAPDDITPETGTPEGSPDGAPEGTGDPSGGLPPDATLDATCADYREVFMACCRNAGGGASCETAAAKLPSDPVTCLREMVAFECAYAPTGTDGGIGGPQDVIKYCCQDLDRCGFANDRVCQCDDTSWDALDCAVGECKLTCDNERCEECCSYDGDGGSEDTYCESFREYEDCSEGPCKHCYEECWDGECYGSCWWEECDEGTGRCNDCYSDCYGGECNDYCEGSSGPGGCYETCDEWDCYLCCDICGGGWVEGEEAEASSGTAASASSGGGSAKAEPARSPLPPAPTEGFEDYDGGWDGCYTECRQIGSADGGRDINPENCWIDEWGTLCCEECWGDECLVGCEIGPGEGGEGSEGTGDWDGGGDECCGPTDYCGWANDGECDCNGRYAWDDRDCGGGRDDFCQSLEILIDHCCRTSADAGAGCFADLWTRYFKGDCEAAYDSFTCDAP